METLRKRVTGIEGEEVTHSHYTVEAQVRALSWVRLSQKKITCVN